MKNIKTNIEKKSEKKKSERISLTIRSLFMCSFILPTTHYDLENKKDNRFLKLKLMLASIKNFACLFLYIL